MKELSPQARIYLVLVIIAGYLAMGELLHRAAAAPETKLVVLLLLAATAAPLTIRLPKLTSHPDSSVSLGLIFVFGALLELPAREAAIVSMVAVASRLWLGDTGKAKLRDYLFHLSASNLSLLVAYDTYHKLLDRPASGKAVALAAAAGLFFLIKTWSRAAAISLEQDRALGLIWLREFLPTAPLYALAVAGGAGVSLLFNPNYLHSLILVFPVICLFYYCYEFYFGRLKAERRQAQEMSELHRRTVEALALAIEAKDRLTGGHLRRVQRYAMEVAQRMGCTGAQIKALEIGSLLHDIGKIAVPEALLFKPGRLTRQEFHQIAVHPQVGAEILAAVNFPFPVAELVHSHHERWDGTGYPRGLKGAEIPLTARILTVADCFDALISDRPYRPAFPVEKAIEVLQVGKSKTFDPQVVDVLLGILPRLQTEFEQEAKREASRPMLQSPMVMETSAMPASSEEVGTGEARPQATAEAGALRELLEAMAPGLHADQVARIVFAELSRITTYDGAAIFLLDGRMLVAVGHTWSRAEGAGPLAVPLREGPTGWAASQASTLVSGNPLGEWGELGRRAQSSQWRDALIVPLWSAGRVAGTLNLYSTVARRFTEEDARVVELMTAGLGIAMVKARAYQKFLGAAPDPSTGLPNTRGTLEWLQQATAEPNAALSVLLLEPAGISNGEAAAVRFVQTVRAHLCEADFLGRLGAQRFLAVLPNVVSHQLQNRLEQFRGDGSTHIGAASFPVDAQAAETLLCLAHQRLLADRSERRPVSAFAAFH